MDKKQRPAPIEIELSDGSILRLDPEKDLIDVVEFNRQVKADVKSGIDYSRFWDDNRTKIN